MRILMIYSTSNLGGAELYALNLLDVLSDEVDFTVVNTPDGFLTKRARKMGIETVEVPISYPEYDIAELITTTNQVKEACEGQSFDLIYTHHLPAAMIGQILSSVWDVPLLMTVDSPYLRQEYQDFMRVVPCYVMSASKSGRDYILENNLCPPEQVFVAQPGINLDEFHKQRSKTKTQAFKRFDLTKQPVIGVVARLVEDKGVDRAIEAAYYLKQQDKLGAKVLIAGDGTEKQNLLDLVNKLDIQDDVSFMGQLQPDEMPDFYQMMDVYVLATNREGCPISILEAMSCGVPVVATAVGDVPYLITSGTNGYTIDTPESVKIAKLISDILESDDFVDRTYQHNQGIISEFDNEQQAKRVYNIFEQILEHYGGKLYGTTSERN